MILLLCRVGIVDLVESAFFEDAVRHTMIANAPNVIVEFVRFPYLRVEVNNIVNKT